MLVLCTLVYYRYTYIRIGNSLISSKNSKPQKLPSPVQSSSVQFNSAKSGFKVGRVIGRPVEGSTWI